MASLTQSNVTIGENWTEGGTNGKRLKCMQVSWTGVTAGGATNTIPATAFGLNKIISVSPILTSANKLYLTATDGSLVYVYDLTVATDANRASPVDLDTTSITANCTVKGY